MGAEWAPLPERRSALFTWLNTWRADERRGTLREIYVAGDAGAPMVSLDAVDCIDGIGLRGDRYAVGQGHWIRTDGCQVTLITTDELRHAASRGGLALEPGWHRRNLVIDGIPAAALRRSRLRIGDVVFAFIGCGHPAATWIASPEQVRQRHSVAAAAWGFTCAATEASSAAIRSNCSTPRVRKRGSEALLPIRAAVVFEPAIDVPCGGVAVRPVQHAALIVPFILAIERDLVALAQAVNARRHIDVVCDEQRLPVVESKYEALVAAAFDVIAQHPLHNAAARDLHVAALRAIGGSDRCRTAVAAGA